MLSSSRSDEPGDAGQATRQQFGPGAVLPLQGTLGPGRAPERATLEGAPLPEASHRAGMLDWLNAAGSSEGVLPPHSKAHNGSDAVQEMTMSGTSSARPMPLSRVSSLTRRSAATLQSLPSPSDEVPRGGNRGLSSGNGLRISIPKQKPRVSPQRATPSGYRKRKSSERDDEMQIPDLPSQSNNISASAIPRSGTVATDAVDLTAGLDHMPAIRESRSSSASHESVPSDAIPGWMDGSEAHAGSTAPMGSDAAASALASGLLPASVAGILPGDASVELVWCTDRALKFVRESSLHADSASRNAALDIDWA